MARNTGHTVGYLGVLVGACGWLIGFVGVCIHAGQWDLLGEVLCPGLALSLALGLSIIIAHACVRRLDGQTHSLVQLTLWGMVLLAVGTLWLLINHWIAPLIQEHSTLQESLPPGTVFHTSDWFPTILLTVAVVLLAVVATKLLRSPPADGSSV